MFPTSEDLPLWIDRIAFFLFYFIILINSLSRWDLCFSIVNFGLTTHLVEKGNVWIDRTICWTDLFDVFPNSLGSEPSNPTRKKINLNRKMQRVHKFSLALFTQLQLPRNVSTKSSEASIVVKPSSIMCSFRFFYFLHEFANLFSIIYVINWSYAHFFVEKIKKIC